MAGADSCSEVFELSEVCVETIVVVDTLGPARRRTHGLCVIGCCQGKKGPGRRPSTAIRRHFASSEPPAIVRVTAGVHV